MNRFFTKSLVLVALVGALTAFSTSRADAALSMTLTSYSAANVQLATSGAIAGVGGVAVFNGAVGSWVVNVDTGIGTPIFPQPKMDLNYTTVGTGGAGEYLVIDFTDTNVLVGSPGFGLTFGGTN